MEGVNVYTAIIAFVGGFFSFLSPCVLPLVPGYISLISGVSVDHLKGEGGSEVSARRAVVVNSLAFNVGLSLIFLSLGAAAGLIGAALFTNRWVGYAAGAVIIVFGLQMMGVLKIGALYRDTRKFSEEKPRGPLGSLLLGIAFAAGWTPCIGPILGGIIGMAATSGGWQGGLVLSAFYAAGLALPFLGTGLAINGFLGFYARFRRHLHKVEVASGALLIAIGFVVMFGGTAWLARQLVWLPSLEAVVDRFWQRQQPPATAGAPADAATGGNAATVKANYPTLPEVEFKTLAGQPYRLADLRGRVVILNFWATWCAPCRAEIPEFNVMQRELGGRGLTVVGVTSHDTPEQIKDFQTEIPQDYTVLIGADDTPERFNNGPGLPVTYVLDRDGRVREKIVGPRDRAGFEALVKPLLDEPTTTASHTQ
jgi:cytochrome c-type biogenesis protein